MKIETPQKSDFTWIQKSNSNPCNRNLNLTYKIQILILFDVWKTRYYAVGSSNHYKMTQTKWRYLLIKKQVKTCYKLNYVYLNLRLRYDLSARVLHKAVRQM